MKTKRFLVFGLPALLLALGLAACHMGGGDNDPAPLKFALSGSFGGGYIKLGSGSGKSLSASVMRLITADSYPLEGTLEYDDVLVRLRGNYDPYTGNWSASARYGEGDSDAVYTFDGNGGYEGVPLRKAGATVMVPVKSPAEGQPEWALAFSPVETNDWSPTGDLNDGVTAGGMPSEMHGYWSAAWDMPILADGDIIHMTMQCLISDWKITATGRRTYTYEDRVIKQNQNILSIEEVTEGEYAGAIDVISCYLEYPEDTANLKAALTAWLGLGEDGITAWNGQGDKPDGPWIADNTGMPYPETGGFSAEQWEDVQSFYAANGWEAWAVDNAAWATAHPNGPNTLFLKYRFQLVGGKLNMTKIVWGEDWYAGSTPFTTLESLNENATHLEHQWVLPEGGSEHEDEGVLTVPYSRSR